MAVVVIAKWPKGADSALASADGVEISESAFKAAYTDWLLTTGVTDAPERRVAYIKDLAATKLVVRNARRDGIEDEPHFKDREDHLSRKLLIDLYMEELVLDTLQVTEQDVRRAYMRAQTQVTARHLYARTRPEADTLHARLKAGEDWDELAREVFRDPKLRQSGGLLPTFSFDETDPNFEEVAFELPLDTYSKPVRTAQGYSIIKVVDRFTRPIITETEFAAKRPLFEVYARDKKRSMARTAYLMNLVDEADIRFNEKTLDALMVRILGEGAAETPDLWDQVLLQFNEPQIRWTVEDFREHARYASDRQRAQVRDATDLREFARGLVTGALILDKARTMEGHPAFKEKLREALDEYIVSHTRRTLEVTVSEHDIETYYNSAPKSEFARPAQVQLTWQTFETDADARHTGGTADSETAWFDRAQLGSMAEDMFAADEGDRFGLYETPQGYVSLVVGPQRAEHVRPLEEVRSNIEAMLRHKRLREERVALYDSLAERHHLNIDVERVTELELGV